MTPTAGRSALLRRLMAGSQPSLRSSAASAPAAGIECAASASLTARRGSVRWSSDVSDAKGKGVSQDASSSSDSSASSSPSASPSPSSSRASPASPQNRKQRYAHKVAPVHQEALLRRPLSSSSSSTPSSQQQGEAPLRPFRLNDYASMTSLLYAADPILDSERVLRTAATRDHPYPTTVVMLNETADGRPLFPPTPPTAASLIEGGGGGGGGGGGNEVDSAQYLASVTQLTPAAINALHRHTLVIKRVVRMTTKGKVASMYALVVAGNARGLVGYGEGKDANAGKAARKAFHEAVKRMDYVKRWEGRTIQSEYTYKWGASKVTLRPRPAGFGLRVPPAIHSLARAAGIADLSASLRGSTNPLNVVKAACQILWSGSNPSGLGDGLGGRGRRNDKGRGMPDAREIELARGRKLREVRLGM